MLEISDTKEIFLHSGGTVTAIYLTAPLKNQKNGYHKDGGISPLGGILIVEMTSSVYLEKYENQDDS